MNSRVKEILDLRTKGFKVVELTPYQYRINGFLDLYPKNGRFHDLRTGERGNYPAMRKTHAGNVFKLTGTTKISPNQSSLC